MPRLKTKRGKNWGTGPGKSLERVSRSDDWRKARNERKRG